MEETCLPIPKAIAKECQNAIEQLQALKSEIVKKKESIQEQDKHFETRLSKIASQNKAIKIDTKEKTALQKDCEHYQKALDALITDIVRESMELNAVLEKETYDKLKTQEDLFFFMVYTKQRLNGAKKFIKKMKKDVAIAHSRFSFGFDTHQKQLNYIEWTNRNR